VIDYDWRNPINAVGWALACAKHARFFYDTHEVRFALDLVNRVVLGQGVFLDELDDANHAVFAPPHDRKGAAGFAALAVTYAVDTARVVVKAQGAWQALTSGGTALANGAIDVEARRAADAAREAFIASGLPAGHSMPDWELIRFQWIIRDLAGGEDPAQDRFDAAVAALLLDDVDLAREILSVRGRRAWVART
jgi:hypothetical protein